MALPEARDADFFGFRRRPSGVADEHVKIINDTALRSRLIDAGIAEGLQSPKGPQRIPSIIRLYPDFDAPSKGAKPAPALRQNGRAVEVPRAAYGLPSVEELQALLARIQSVESDVSGEMQGEINAQITKLKREIGGLEGDDFERAFRELDQALRARREIAAQVRERAFLRVEADASFEPRKYLRLIAREPKI
ncbi:MAG: hypothetical protein NVSMB5_23720 [Candidatus Velthaea sp.]